MTPPLDLGIVRILRLIATLTSESFVVGGTIRDLLLGRSSGADLDLAVKGDGFEVARNLKKKIGWPTAFVPLDKDRGVGRVVLRGKAPLIVDISSLKGDDIHADLVARDFTINALAVKAEDFLESGLDRIVDYTGGLNDLADKTLRLCDGHRTLADDPLRVVRAFRFAACLGFTLAPETSAAVREHAHAVTAVAPERIRDELVMILSADGSADIVRRMDEAGLVAVLFPELLPMQGCTQNDYHHLDVWGHTLEAIERFEALVRGDGPDLGSTAERVVRYVNEEPVTGRPRRVLLKLAVLYHDAGKPACRAIDPNGRVRFFRHEQKSREIFQERGLQLKLATREITAISQWVEGHMRAMVLTAESVSRRTISRIHRLFGDDVPGLFLLFLADLGATRGPSRKPMEEQRALRGVLKALEICDEWESEATPSLLTGRDVMSLFGVSPGPFLGKILKNLNELQRIGEITTKEEAVAAAQALLEPQDGHRGDRP